MLAGRLLKSGRSIAALVLVFTAPMAGAEDAASLIRAAMEGEFSRNAVVDLARKLSRQSYQKPDTSLPEVLQDLSYSEYHSIRFNPDRALWAGTGLPFQMQLFHRGFFYRERIDIAVVDEGEVRRLKYSPDRFLTSDGMTKALPEKDIGFAGFRLHNPINRPDYFDELVVFLGGSYFRGLGKGSIYGTSARGLALNTADPKGEEFPVFRAFWVEKPSERSTSIVVHALLDSPSVAGAYRFTIVPGKTTVMDVEATLFPREDLHNVGLAPASSMFMFAFSGRQGVDDFRPEVHDSEGLLMINGRGERLWRPLVNPELLQISVFVDRSPRGFGLMQRDRRFHSYQDLDLHYERRPSLWVEPIGDWGEGRFVLVEIPSKSETNDNIVAYWKPDGTIAKGEEYSFSYHLKWGDHPIDNTDVHIVRKTRHGQAGVTGPTDKRRFVVDYVLPATSDGKNNAGDKRQGDNREGAAGKGPPEASVETSAGSVSDVKVRKNDVTGGYRLSFELDPADEELVELRAQLKYPDKLPAETWVYRWTE